MTAFGKFREWTSHEITQLKKLWNQGKAPLTIAVKLGRSTLAVAEKARRLGLKSNNRHRTAWSSDEDRTLMELWGSRDVLTIARRIGRTPTSVTARAKKLKLDLPHRRYGATLGELVSCTGHSRNKLKAAMGELGIEFKVVKTRTDTRFPRTERLIVRHADINKLLAFIESTPRIFKDQEGSGHTTRGKWGVGKKPDACIGCGTNKKPHYARGRCTTCYNRWLAKEKRCSPSPSSPPAESSKRSTASSATTSCPSKR